MAISQSRIDLVDLSALFSAVFPTVEPQARKSLTLERHSFGGIFTEKKSNMDTAVESRDQFRVYLNMSMLHPNPGLNPTGATAYGLVVHVLANRTRHIL